MAARSPSVSVIEGKGPIRDILSDVSRVRVPRDWARVELVTLTYVKGVNEW